MGVGQAETSVYDMVDIFLVLLLPSGGDELQGIKKGIIEMADLIVVNKADGELKKTAEITQREYKNAAHISKKSRTNSSIGVFTCSSLNLLGLDQIWTFITKFIKNRKYHKDFYKERNLQRFKHMWNMVDFKIEEFIEDEVDSKKFIKTVIKKIETDKLSIHNAANMIFNSIIKK